jgi:antagonist of KipI
MRKKKRTDPAKSYSPAEHSSPTTNHSSLRILETGLCTLVVDFGRPGYRSLGVPVGGAADRFSMSIGNALVGNPPDAAALEICLTGPTLEAGGDLACVLFGAPFTLADDQRQLVAGKTFTLHGGERLRIGGTSAGARAYFCVRGGFQRQPILGSHSALEPVRAGDELSCLPGSISVRFVHPDWTWNQDPKTLRVLDGLQAGWFRLEEFLSRQYTITPASNRMGLRLESDPLKCPDRELVSEPVCPGAVQVTRDGQCIVLGVDGQTIGGYPKIAQVISADLDKLGQLRPGDRIRFHRIRLEEAEALYHQKQKELHDWTTRLSEGLI